MIHLLDSPFLSTTPSKLVKLVTAELLVYQGSFASDNLVDWLILFNRKVKQVNKMASSGAVKGINLSN